MEAIFKGTYMIQCKTIRIKVEDLFLSFKHLIAKRLLVSDPASLSPPPCYELGDLPHFEVFSF